MPLWRDAFTLLELLVLMAILALPATLVATAYGHVHSCGITFEGTGRLRQRGGALGAYVGREGKKIAATKSFMLHA